MQLNEGNTFFVLVKTLFPIATTPNSPKTVLAKKLQNE